MFLRCHARKKNGKLHRYWSVVESRRLAGGQSAQRQLLYLGEINDSQETAWRRNIEVFDQDKEQSRQACLFPDDRPIPADEVNALSLRMSQMCLLRPRNFGDCWLGCLLWRELGLDRFWQEQLGDERGGVPWEKVLQLLAINRLCQPGSEFALHRHWFVNSAMDELLESDFAVAEKDRLYRCLDRVLIHKDALCRHLVERWKTLFDARFDILLYDLTSTYFEGSGEQIPKARHGHSRDGRPDCRQVVIALVVTTDGLPLAYEVLAGNTSDKTTLTLFLEKIQSMYGKARRVWVMDRGIPTEATLAKMREDEVAYLVGTPRSSLDKLEKSLLDKPWEPWPAGMEKQASVLWQWYMQLVRVEESFKTLKGDLSLRPIHHQIEKRVEAHILVAFLGYCLATTLRLKLSVAAPGLTPRAALQSLSKIQMLEVHVPTSDGRVLVMPRHTEPEAQQQMILARLGLSLPPQPPPRIREGKLELAATSREIL